MKFSRTAIFGGAVLLAAGLSLAGASAASAATTPSPSPTASSNPSTDTVQSSAMYVYKKLDPAKPASWTNSGPQTLLATWDGWSYKTTFPAMVPKDTLCGPGWAIQEDQITGPQSAFPTHITYPNGNTGGPVHASEHLELSSIMTVPACTTVVTGVPVITTGPPVCPTAHDPLPPYNTFSYVIPQGLSVVGLTGTDSGKAEEYPVQFGAGDGLYGHKILKVTVLPGYTYSGPATLGVDFVNPSTLHCTPAGTPSGTATPANPATSAKPTTSATPVPAAATPDQPALADTGANATKAVGLGVLLLAIGGAAVGFTVYRRRAARG